MVSFLYCNSLTVKILNHITKISIDDLGDNATSIDTLFFKKQKDSIEKFFNSYMDNEDFFWNLSY